MQRSNGQKSRGREGPKLPKVTCKSNVKISKSPDTIHRFDSITMHHTYITSHEYQNLYGIFTTARDGPKQHPHITIAKVGSLVAQ